VFPVTLGERRLVPNAAFENFAKDQTRLFEVTLFEHDLPDDVEQIGPHAVVTGVIETRELAHSRVQQADRPVNVAFTPKRDRETANHVHNERMVLFQAIGVGVQRSEKDLNLRRFPLVFAGGWCQHFLLSFLTYDIFQKLRFPRVLPAKTIKGGMTC
jgi:hypothetical protein